MATLERKKAYVAEQQRQLAAMMKNAEQVPIAKRVREKLATEKTLVVKASTMQSTPPWAKRRLVVANASVSPPSVNVAWGKWQRACMIHPRSHATCNIMKGAPRAKAKGAAFVTKGTVCEAMDVQAEGSVAAAVNAELSDTVSKSIITGPEVEALRERLQMPNDHAADANKVKDGVAAVEFEQKCSRWLVPVYPRCSECACSRTCY